MLIGRKKEQEELLRAYQSEYSEFVAVTGRRRIGKTFLVRETFGYKFAFQHSGIANQKTRIQLQEFRQSLIQSGMKKCRMPSDWFDAFNLLSQFLNNLPKGKKVVFIDELPWMDAPRSHFVSALEHFWNGFATARKDILLIICGSATSWIINNVFRNHGGLHNRVTYRIHLSPFTLHECELYAQSRRLDMTRFGILECYMVMGGVPFYWSLLERGRSVAQNIDNLMFSPMGKLRYEYRELYDSLFKNPEPYLEIVSLLGTKRIGMTREEMVKEGNVPSNGQLTKVLENLEACGFIRAYSINGRRHRNLRYQLIDNFTLFYYKFLHNNAGVDEAFWSNNLNTPSTNTWQGLAFEQVCFEHIRQIKWALGIGGVVTKIYSWQIGGDDEGRTGAQVDLVIDRADRNVNLCEMKFSTTKYAVNKEDDADWRHKQVRFMETSKPFKGAFMTLITPFGVKEGMYQFSAHNVLTLDDLFKE